MIVTVTISNGELWSPEVPAICGHPSCDPTDCDHLWECQRALMCSFMLFLYRFQPLGRVVSSAEFVVCRFCVLFPVVIARGALKRSYHMIRWCWPYLVYRTFVDSSVLFPEILRTSLSLSLSLSLSFPYWFLLMCMFL